MLKPVKERMRKLTFAVGFRLEPQYLEALQRRATAEDRSVAATVAHMVKDALAKPRKENATA
jgi:hypothetical protein